MLLLSLHSPSRLSALEQHCSGEGGLNTKKVYKSMSKIVVWNISYASVKTLEREGRISSSSNFCGQLADYYSHVFSVIHTLPLDEFSFKEIRTWGQSKISSCCLCVWCKSRELGGKGSSRFPTPTMESFSADLLPAIKGYWAELNLELFTLLRLNPGVRGEHLTCVLSWIAAWLLLIACIWSVYLVDEFVLGVL